MIEWIIVVVYILLIAAGWLAVSALPTTAGRQQHRAAPTDTSATPTPPITPDVEAGVSYPPASLFPRASATGAGATLGDRGRGIGSRRGGRRA